jgi:cyclic-di-GMP-binding protein
MANSFLGMFRGAKQDDPLTSVKAVNAWAAGLPAKDPLGALEAIVRVLEDMGTAQPEVTPNRVLALMALDRLSLPMQAKVQLQYRLPAVSEDVRRRLWYACNNLARWFAHAYELVCGDTEAQNDKKRPRPQAHGIFSRMFYYRGLQAKLGLFHYESWIPGSWEVLRNAYREACAQGVAAEPFALPESTNPGDSYSAEQEFLQILLLQRVNSGNLAAQQVEWAAQWLRSCVRTLNLSEPPAEGDGEGDGYWLDLEQGEGLVAKRPATPPAELRYVDIRPLHEQLGALIARLGEQLARSGNGADQPDLHAMEEQLKLAKRLDHLWRPQPQQRPRRGERQAEKGTVVVAAGWTAIARAMRVSAVRRPHEPRQYTYDEATTLSVHGHVRHAQRDRHGNTIMPDPGQHGWYLHDISKSGARIVSASKEAQQQQIGALLALQPDGDTHWRIGIVRRLRRRTAEHTELGVEIIAENAIMMKVSPPAVRASGYSVDGIDTLAFDALYLPPQQHSGSKPVRSLVLPAAEFASGRRLSITVEGTDHEIRLFATLDRTKEWVWTAFEIPGEAKKA